MVGGEVRDRFVDALGTQGGAAHEAGFDVELGEAVADPVDQVGGLRVAVFAGQRETLFGDRAESAEAIEQLEDDSAKMGETVIDPHLVVRSTTAPPHRS